jgi:hypothetical protein
LQQDLRRHDDLGKVCVKVPATVPCTVKTPLQPAGDAVTTLAAVPVPLPNWKLSAAGQLTGTPLTDGFTAVELI